MAGFQLMKQNINLGRQLWQDILKQSLGVQRGEIQPQETPMFKQMAQYLMSLGKSQDANLMKEASSKGITGGALEQLMRGSNEDRMKQTMNLINQIYGGSTQLGLNTADKAEQDWVNWMNMIMGYKNLHKQLKAEKKKQQGGQIMQGIGMLSSGLSRGLTSGGGGMGGVGGA